MGGLAAAQIVVSPRPLAAAWSRLEAFPEAEAAARASAVGYYPRPTLRVDYVAPRNETEEFIAQIWKDLLGVAQVGIHDDHLLAGAGERDSQVGGHGRLAVTLQRARDRDAPVPASRLGLS